MYLGERRDVARLKKGDTMNSTTIADTITTLSAQTMLDLQARAQARVSDILEFTRDVETVDWYLRHYTEQRREAINEGDVSAAVWCEYVLTNLERTLTL
jgi:hypothetical protein